MSDDENWDGYENIVSEDFPGEVEIHIRPEDFYKWDLEPEELFAALRIGRFVLRDALKDSMLLGSVMKDNSLRFVVCCGEGDVDIRFDPTKAIDQLLERALDGNDFIHCADEKENVQAALAWLESQAKRLSDILAATPQPEGDDGRCIDSHQPWCCRARELASG